ncbi:transposase [Massilia sp. B-10]|nr:transposase [Massilia sp. B-10]
MALSELAAKGADADFIKQTLQFALQRLMEMDVEALCKAAYGERSEERANSRNGYRERALETRAKHSRPEDTQAAYWELFP